MDGLSSRPKILKLIPSLNQSLSGNHNVYCNELNLFLGYGTSLDCRASEVAADGTIYDAFN